MSTAAQTTAAIASRTALEPRTSHGSTAAPTPTGSPRTARRWSAWGRSHGWRRCRASPPRPRARASRPPARATGASCSRRRRAAARRGSATSSRGRPASPAATTTMPVRPAPDMPPRGPRGRAAARARPSTSRSPDAGPATAGARGGEQQQCGARASCHHQPDGRSQHTPHPDGARQREAPALRAHRRVRWGMRRSWGATPSSRRDGLRDPIDARRRPAWRQSTASETVRCSAGAGTAACTSGTSVAAGQSAISSRERARAVRGRSRPRLRVRPCCQSLFEDDAQILQCPATVRVDRQSGVERAHECARQVRAARRQRGQLTPDTPGGGGGRGSAHGVGAREPLVQDERQRVQVGGLADLAAFALLGSHVGERAERLAGTRERVFAGQAGAAEVGQLGRRPAHIAIVGTSTFCGLTSRWTTPRAWAWARAWARARPIWSSSSSEQLVRGDERGEGVAVDELGYEVERVVVEHTPRTAPRSRGGPGARRRAPRGLRAHRPGCLVAAVRRGRAAGGSGYALERDLAVQLLVLRRARPRRTRRRRDARAGGSGRAAARRPEAVRPRRAQSWTRVCRESTGWRVRRPQARFLHESTGKCGLTEKLQVHRRSRRAVILSPLLNKSLQRSP